MFQKGDDRGPPTSLRGWLSDVYLPALLDKAHIDASLEAIVRRLGNRSTVDDPIFGRASGMPSVEEHVRKLSAWFLERGGTYERTAFTTGIDRDVTEGTLSLALESKTVELPIAVVAEKRRSREVELRLYFATEPIKGTTVARPALVAPNPELSLPAGVTELLDLLAKGSIQGLVDAFETDGALRDSRGLLHTKTSGGLKEYFEKLLAGGAFGGNSYDRGGAADDGRTCALELTLTKNCGRDVPPRAGLVLFERGDSGLLRSVRFYDDPES